jgi:hypothetical protein
MNVKSLKCNIDNPDTVRFCGECGDLLRSVRGADPTDVRPAPRFGRPPEDVPVPFTATMETPEEELTKGAIFVSR